MHLQTNMLWVDPCWYVIYILTHWGRVTHICVSKLTIIGSDNGLSPGRRQAIIWTNTGILLIGPLETNFSNILIEIHIFSFRKMHFKISSGKWRPFCLGPHGLMYTYVCVYVLNCTCIASIIRISGRCKIKWRYSLALRYNISTYNIYSKSIVNVTNYS